MVCSFFFRPKSQHPLQRTARGARFTRPPRLFLQRVLRCGAEQKCIPKKCRPNLFPDRAECLASGARSRLQGRPKNTKKRKKKKQKTKNTPGPANQKSKLRGIRGHPRSRFAFIFCASERAWGAQEGSTSTVDPTLENTLFFFEGSCVLLFFVYFLAFQVQLGARNAEIQGWHSIGCVLLRSRDCMFFVVFEACFLDFPVSLQPRVL